jgi:Tol biopolymer transport system component
MPLIPGTPFGTFEVLSLLGTGGMGEVYRARDTRLGRDVALKVVPAAFAMEPGRLERFDREARALAALNHPAIASIYSVEEVEGTRALVLELVEGDTLEDRLRRGPLRPDEATRIARAVADALEAAHDRGLVHRDVKPANIKITPAGDVKVLDFGIAKILHADDTATSTGTAHGAVVGTAAYMSPEQARGSHVDKRTDIWAFGCLLYEMLTGVAPFRGPTWSDSIARTLTEDPDWARLESAAPSHIVQIVRRCLQKEPGQRLRGLGAIDVALDGPAAATTIRRPRSSTVAAGMAAAAIALALIAVAWSYRSAAPVVDERVVRFEIPATIRVAESGSLALSPDGRRLAFVGTGADGVFRMWERSLDSQETRPISGTEGEIAANSTIFWSPDSRSIGFYADGAVRRIGREGGQSRIVCRVAGVAVGGTWNTRDEIVVGNTSGGLKRCPASGGEPVSVTRDDGQIGAQREMLHLFPVFLPDGEHLLYLGVSRTDPSRNGLYLANVRRSPDEQPAGRVIETGFAARFAPGAGAGPDRILFIRNRGVWAVAFDTDRLQSDGEATQVVSSVGTFRDGAFFDANATTFVYRSGVPDYQLSWRSRGGDDLGVVGEPGQYLGLALSPDATRAAVARENKLNRSDQDVWIVDLTRNAMTRFTTNPHPKSAPAWSSRGDALLFAVGHDNSDVIMRPTSGSNERILLSSASLKGMSVNPLLTTMSMSADGATLAFSVDTRGRNRSDIWTLKVGDPGSARPLIEAEFDQLQPSLSPDGRWLAYASNESGISEVLVRPLSSGTDGFTVGGPIAVSRGGGRSPRWRADSGELYFHAADGGVMAARVARDTIEQPVRLFAVQGALPEWGATAAGDRFLFALPAASQNVPFGVILNWQIEMK